MLLRLWRAPKRQQASLVRMQSPSEALHPFVEYRYHTPRIVLTLTATDKSSSAGELHPHALTEPDVNLAAHPALIVQSQDECQYATTRTAAVHGVQCGPTSAPLVVDGASVVCICAVPSTQARVPGTAIPG
jgi:hypothetical protein